MRLSSLARGPLAGSLLVASVLANAGQTPPPYFTKLDLGSRFSSSFYNARLKQWGSVLVNDDWSVVSGTTATSVVTSSIRAFRWTRATGVQSLGQLGNDGSFLRGMSADGSVLYGDSQLSSGVGTPSVFVWDAAGGLRAKGSIPLLGSITGKLSNDKGYVFGVATQSPDVQEFFRANVNGPGETRSGSLSTGNHLRLTDLSQDGRVAVGVTQINNQPRVVRWAEGGTLIDIGSINGGRTELVGMNATGTSIIAQSTNASGYSLTTRWTPETGLQKLGDNTVRESSAQFLSQDGSTIVGSFGGLYGNRVFRSTGGGFQDLGHLGSYNSYLVATYDEGNRVYARSGKVLYDNSGLFRWTTTGGFVDLSIPGATSTDFAGTSGDGSVELLQGVTGGVTTLYRSVVGGNMTALDRVGGAVPGIYSVSETGDRMIATVGAGTAPGLYSWSEAEGFESMGLIPGATSATITHVLDDLRFVAGVSKVSNVDQAWLWDATYGMVDLKTLLVGKGLDLSGWDSLNKIELLEDREGVAYIQGLGTYQGAAGTKFHAVVPEPASLVALGSFSLVFLRRRRKGTKA